MSGGRLAATLAGLKLISYGGPVAMAFSTAGSMLLGWAMWDQANAHYDVAVVLGITAIMLGFVEWALARRFAAHEVVEHNQYAALGIIADAAAAAATDAARNLRELRDEIERNRERVAAVAVDVAILGRRVAAIEDRWMRPGIIHSPLQGPPK